MDPDFRQDDANGSMRKFDALSEIRGLVIKPFRPAKDLPCDRQIELQDEKSENAERGVDRDPA